MTSKKYCKCPECGSECEIDTSIVLTSIPPQYQAFCKNCNKVIYTLCSNTYGKISMNRKNNIIKKDVDYLNDIHRIADALEKLAKYFTEDNKIGVKEKTAPVIPPILISPSISNSCEGCWYYQQQKANPNPTITIGDTPCTWCPKLQPTCGVTNNGK